MSAVSRCFCTDTVRGFRSRAVFYSPDALLSEAQPLTAPEVTPSIMYYWKKVNSATGGIIPISEDAAIICQRMVVSLSIE